MCVISLVARGIIAIAPVVIEFDEKAILNFPHLVALLSKSLCLALHQSLWSQEILVVEAKDDDGYNKGDEKNHSENIISLRHIMSNLFSQN